MLPKFERNATQTAAIKAIVAKPASQALARPLRRGAPIVSLPSMTVLHASCGNPVRNLRPGCYRREIFSRRRSIGIVRQTGQSRNIRVLALREAYKYF